MTYKHGCHRLQLLIYTLITFTHSWLLIMHTWTYLHHQHIERISIHSHKATYELCVFVAEQLCLKMIFKKWQKHQQWTFIFTLVLNCYKWLILWKPLWSYAAHFYKVFWTDIYCKSKMLKSNSSEKKTRKIYNTYPIAAVSYSWIFKGLLCRLFFGLDL